MPCAPVAPERVSVAVTSGADGAGGAGVPRHADAKIASEQLVKHQPLIGIQLRPCADDHFALLGIAHFSQRPKALFDDFMERRRLLMVLIFWKD